MHQPVDSLHMGVIQSALGERIAGEAAGHELAIEKTRVFGHDDEVGPRARWFQNHTIDTSGRGRVGLVQAPGARRQMVRT